MDYKIDEFDFELLSKLQRDGRKSYSELASIMKVSVNTIKNRINYLLKNKILNIIGRVDTNLVGFEAYVQVRIKVRPAKKIELVANKLSKLEETSFVALCSGSFDIEINLMCVNKEHLIKTMEKIYAIDGIDDCITSDYFKVFKVEQPNLSLIKKNRK